jgi:hypothetical protein
MAVKLSPLLSLSLVLVTVYQAVQAATSVEPRRTATTPSAAPPSTSSCGAGSNHPNAACSCADFCANKCACSSMPTKTLTLIRLTPYNITDLACKNTGDAAGDVFFTMDRIALGEQCANDPTNPRCFLDGNDVYIQFSVEVDGNFGPYQRCNPLHGSLSEPFYCCQGSSAPCRGDHTSAGSMPYCVCPRQNTSVGVESVAKTHSGRGSWVGEIATILQGYWFSTPREGECHGSQKPGDGSRCTWKIVDVASKKNATCVRERTFQAVYNKGSACFESCPGWPHNLDWTTSCYVHCFESTVLGTGNHQSTHAGSKATPMTQAELVGPFQRAMELEDAAEGGCPSLP